MLESDVHTPAEHAVKPKRDLNEPPTTPKELPIIVKDKDPEEGEFVKTTLETGAAHDSAETTQKEKAREYVVTRMTLMTAESAIPAPEENFNIVDDEDSHLVENVDDLDIRDATEASND